jgi:uncharacterized protein YyaL (SSP411 family)
MAEYRAPPSVVVLTGATWALVPWRQALTHRYRPHVLLIEPGDDPGALPAELVKPTRAEPLAWVCHGPQCLPPISDIATLLATLDEPAFAGCGPSST